MGTPEDERTATVAPRSSETAAPEPTTVLAKGEKVGRYEVLEVIGEGGMGKVYAALDPDLSRRVALKLLHVPKGTNAKDTGGSSRLLREAQALAQLAHPNVVTIYDVGTFGDGVFLAMELVEGKNLSAWVKEKPRGWAEVLAVFQAAGEGLAAAHAKGLIHRDFKPDNVLLGADGRVRVVDFGLARALHSGDPFTARPSDLVMSDVLATPLTADGAFSGTVGYIAPEQLAERPHVDERSDQFAFAVSLFAALYGRRPFNGKTFLEYYQSVNAGPPASPPEGDVPLWLFRAVTRAMALDPGARFPDMRSLLVTLSVDPRRKRRLALGAAAAVVAMAATAAFAGKTIFRAPPHPSCVAAAPLAQVWSPKRKAALAAAFSASKHPDTEGTVQKSSELLDAYATAWVVARNKTCAQLETLESERPLLVLTCLGQLKDQLDALLVELEKADLDVTGHAVGAVQSLSHPDRCDDPRVLLGNLTAPLDPKLRLKAEALRARLVSARALSDAGKYGEAVERLTALKAEAKEAQTGQVLADTLILLGRLQSRMGKIDETAATLTEAMTVAQHEGLDLQAFQAAARLAFNDSNNGRPQTAALAYQMAKASYDRLPKSKYLEAELTEALASLLGSQNKYEEALKERKHVLELRVETLGQNHVETIAALNNVAKGELEVGRVVESEASMMRAAALCERVLGLSHPGTSITLSNHGDTLNQLGRYEDAKAVLLHSLEVAEKFHGRDSPHTGWALLNLCVARTHTGEAAEAMEQCSRAVTIEESAEDEPALSQALAFRGDAHAALGQWDAARADCTRGIAVARKAGDVLEGISAQLCLTRVRLHDGDVKGLEPDLLAWLERIKASFHPERAAFLFSLAQVRWLEPKTRAQAVADAEASRQLYAGVETLAPRRVEVEKWLASHTVK